MRRGMTIDRLQEQVRRFAEVRDWEKFHTPKNLAMALMVEAAELLEHFQWVTPAESAALAATKKRAVAQEIADVLIYLLRLSDVLDIDARTLIGVFEAPGQCAQVSGLAFPGLGREVLPPAAGTASSIIAGAVIAGTRDITANRTGHRCRSAPFDSQEF